MNPYDRLAALTSLLRHLPNAVFFVDDVDAVDLARLGPIIEHDAAFPERVNINVASIDGNEIRLTVWERGAGLTGACGTGAGCGGACCGAGRSAGQGPDTGRRGGHGSGARRGARGYLPAMPIGLLKDIHASVPAYRRLLGLDIGEKTIGLAVCDPMHSIATPLHTIQRVKFTKDIEELQKVVDSLGASSALPALPTIEVSDQGRVTPVACLEMNNSETHWERKVFVKVWFQYPGQDRKSTRLNSSH